MGTRPESKLYPGGYNLEAVARRKENDEWFFQIGAELQRLSDEVMRGIVATSSAARRYWRPHVDICESEDSVAITAELAGVEPDAISVHYSPQRNTLAIRGNRVQEIGDEDCPLTRSHQLEIFYGEFEREMILPEVSLDPSGIKAAFSNGLLCITIPKRKESPQRRTIAITQENG